MIKIVVAFLVEGQVPVYRSGWSGWPIDQAARSIKLAKSAGDEHPAVGRVVNWFVIGNSS
jgi:hypothetical protein